MRHWYYDRAGTSRWSGPHVLGDTTFRPVVDVVAWQYGRLDVFAIDTNNEMRHNHAEHARVPFGAWENLHGIFR
jgi:hypothetical protein